MRVKMMAVAIAGIGWSMPVAPAVAQHEGHQMPGTAAPANANVAACAQNARTVISAIDQASARVEDARQSNDPATLRAVVGDLQLVLAQMKAQLADCVALSQPTPAGTGTANMAGMAHSKMNMGSAPKPADAEPSPPNTAQTAVLDIAFTSEPSPPRTGDNRFEVTVKDKGGNAVDADAGDAQTHARVRRKRRVSRRRQRRHGRSLGRDRHRDAKRATDRIEEGQRHGAMTPGSDTDADRAQRGQGPRQGTTTLRTGT